MNYEIEPGLRQRAEIILRSNSNLRGTEYLKSKIKRVLDSASIPFSPVVGAISAGAGLMVYIDDRHFPFVNLGLEEDGVIQEGIPWWKVRTMVPGAREMESEVVGNRSLYEFKLEGNDPRVTRAGKLIRYHHIDELPQILNAAMGKTSLVGPRIPAAIEWEKEILPNKEVEPYKRFVELLGEGMKFGATGMFVIFRDELDSMQTRVALEVMYGEGATFVGDIRILAMTLPRFLKSSG